MSENRVVAEGSLWRISGVNYTDKEFARITGAVKATNISGDIWRLYFEPTKTPNVKGMEDLTGAIRAQIIAEPDHKAKVTPTIGAPA